MRALGGDRMTRWEGPAAGVFVVLLLTFLFIGRPMGESLAGPRSAAVVLDPHIQALVDSVDSSLLMERIQILQDFHTRHTWSDTTNPDTGIGAARRWIVAELESVAVATGGALTPSYFDWWQLGRWSRNVMATLPGTMPESADRVFLLGGHYDSRTHFLNDSESFAPGADDNGTGASAVMEAARLMAPHSWETSLEFHLFSGEEQGLHGSKHYAAWADTNGIDIRGALILDMIGGIVDTDGNVDSVRVRLYADSLGLSRNMERYLKRVGEAYVPDALTVMKTKPDRPNRGTDHLSFSDRGITAMRFVEMRYSSRRNHNAYDLIDSLSAGYVHLNARLALAAIASLALAPASPEGLAAEITPEGHLHLSWPTSNPEPDLAGYLVAYRYADPAEALDDTSIVSAPAYVMVDVGMANEHILIGPEPGDSIWVGLASVDTEGHESLVSAESSLVMPEATEVAGLWPGETLLVGLGAPHPNPAAGELEILLSLGPAGAPVRLQVYDVRGRLVRTLLEGPLPPGHRALSWDLADENGRRVPAGVYLCRFEVGGRGISRKVVVAP